jgi:hypothetical protein
MKFIHLYLPAMYEVWFGRLGLNPSLTLPLGECAMSFVPKSAEANWAAAVPKSVQP